MVSKFCFVPVKSSKSLQVLKGCCPTVFDDLVDCLSSAAKFKIQYKSCLGKKVHIAVCPFVNGTVCMSDLIIVL